MNARSDTRLLKHDIRLSFYRHWHEIPETRRLLATFIPDNDYGIRKGYYTKYGLVCLLRLYQYMPKAVQFIADMME